MALCGYWTSKLHTRLQTGEFFLFPQRKIYACSSSLGFLEFFGGIAVAHLVGCRFAFGEKTDASPSPLPSVASKCYLFFFVQQLWKRKDMSEISCWLKSIHSMKCQ